MDTHNERTSARVASIAARGIRKPESLTLAEISAVCATALTQAPRVTLPKQKSLLAKIKSIAVGD